jgi:23S rRNA pseudouridine955/2504/2580 synthase
MNVEQQIIGAKNSRPRRTGMPLPTTSPLGAPPAAVERLIIDEGSVGQRLDNFLLKVWKTVPKTHVYRVIRSGEVRVNKGRAQAETRLKLGDEVRLPPVRQSAQAPSAVVPGREFTVLLEDEHVLAIDKPSGVAVHGGSGVSFGVIEQLRSARPQARFLELVHRLDRDTSGVLLLAKKRSALTALQEQFRARETDKVYATIVYGAFPSGQKVIDVPLHKYLTAEGERRVRASHVGDELAKRSVTLARAVAVKGGFSLLDVTIKTGRTHQIRVHLAHAGFPLVGDDKYGDFALNKALAKAGRAQRLLLHARRLAFDHPATGERVVLEAAVPDEFQQFLDAT